MFDNSSRNVSDWCYNKQYQYYKISEYWDDPNVVFDLYDPVASRGFILLFFSFVSLFYIGVTLFAYSLLQNKRKFDRNLAIIIFIGDAFLACVGTGIQSHIKRIPCFIILISYSIGYPMAFLGVLGKISLMYVDFVNSLKREKINNSNKYDGLYMKSDLNNINIKNMESSSISNSFSSIPRDLPFMKYITYKNINRTIIIVTSIFIVYAFVAQYFSPFFKLNGEIGYCNPGTWELMPHYLLLYISLILSLSLLARMLYIKNRKVKVDKSVYISIFIGAVIFIIFMLFNYVPELKYKIIAIDPAFVFCVFIDYCHTIFVVIPTYRMLSVKYLQTNLDKSMSSLLFVIENPELYNEFVKFCTVEFCIENLIFHKRVIQLKRDIDDYEKTNLKAYKKMKMMNSPFEEGDFDIIDEYYKGIYEKNDKKFDYEVDIKSDYIPEIFYQDAIEIYKKYISHDSIFEINIPNKIYHEIHKNINNSQRLIPQNIFDAADLEVLNNLYNDTFQKFIKYQKQVKHYDVMELLLIKGDEIKSTEE